MVTKRELLLGAGAAGIGAALPFSTVAARPITHFAKHDAASSRIVDHSAFETILTPHHQLGADGITRLDYGALKGGRHADLKRYIAALEGVSVTSLNRDEQFAYWANLYNAVTVDVILDEYPVRSIRDITNGLFSFGPWKIDRVTVEAIVLSLDDIEHNILRALWDDNRVHYAVNCASIGCPNLGAMPFSAATLDETLTRNARAYINHPRGAKLDERGRLIVSRIYSWFDEDFGGSKKGVLDHMRRYASAETLEMLERAGRIRGYDYDWALNDTATYQG